MKETIISNIDECIDMLEELPSKVYTIDITMKTQIAECYHKYNEILISLLPIRDVLQDKISRIMLPTITQPFSYDALFKLTIYKRLFTTGVIPSHFKLPNESSHRVDLPFLVYNYMSVLYMLLSFCYEKQDNKRPDQIEDVYTTIPYFIAQFKTMLDKLKVLIENISTREFCKE